MTQRCPDILFEEEVPFFEVAYFQSQYPYPADSDSIQHPVFQRPYSLGSDGKTIRFGCYFPLQQYPRHPARNHFAELCAESTVTPSFSSGSRLLAKQAFDRWKIERGYAFSKTP